MNINKSDITIGIVTALPEEYHAVKAILENAKDFSELDDPSYYTVGQIKVHDNFGGGLHKVALNVPSKMGNNSASAIASHLTRTFKEVKYLFMVGIAGGMPQHVKLGDIVVAKKIVQYDYGKREGSEKFSLKGEPLLASEPLLKVHRYLELQKDPCFWKNHLDSIVDLLSGQNLGSGFRFERPEDLEKHPQVFCAAIGSANTVLKDAPFRDKLSSEYGIYAVEMEGSGIADAANMKGLNFIVIRGICDYCDQSKKDEWHGYAAAVAAAYTKALIEVLRKKEGKSSPKPTELVIKAKKISNDNKDNPLLQKLKNIEYLFVRARYDQAYTQFRDLCDDYPDYQIQASMILTRYQDFENQVISGIIPAQNIVKLEIATAFQTCLRQFKQEYLENE